MEKKELINDISFRQQCIKYGLDWENCEIYDDVILLNAPIENLYVMLDKNYNIISIESKSSNECKRDFVKREYYGYNLSSLDYSPFKNFSLKQIVDIASRIEISKNYHGHSLSTKINGELFSRESDEEADYYQLLSYIKFLGEEIKRFFSLSYQWKVLGFDAPNIYEYLRHLICRIDNCINACITNNKRPWPADVLSSIGRNNEESNLDGIFFDIIDLLMREKGYKAKSGNPDEIEIFDKPNSESSLSNLSTQILKILDLSDADLKKKEEDIRKKDIEMQIAGLVPWLEEDIEDDVEDDVAPPDKPTRGLKKN